jgi:hypothetical protein
MLTHLEHGDKMKFIEKLFLIVCPLFIYYGFLSLIWIHWLSSDFDGWALAIIEPILFILIIKFILFNKDSHSKQRIAFLVFIFLNAIFRDLFGRLIIFIEEKKLAFENDLMLWFAGFIGLQLIIGFIFFEIINFIAQKHSRGGTGSHRMPPT